MTFITNRQQERCQTNRVKGCIAADQARRPFRAAVQADHWKRREAAVKGGREAAAEAGSAEKTIANEGLRLESAYARTIGMLLGRVKAHGYKWRRWVLRNRFKQPLVKKVIPQKHQVKKLISMDLQGNGTICKRLLN